MAGQEANVPTCDLPLDDLIGGITKRGGDRVRGDFLKAAKIVKTTTPDDTDGRRDGVRYFHANRRKTFFKTWASLLTSVKKTGPS